MKKKIFFIWNSFCCFLSRECVVKTKRIELETGVCIRLQSLICCCRDYLYESVPLLLAPKSTSSILNLAQWISSQSFEVIFFLLKPQSWGSWLSYGSGLNKKRLKGENNGRNEKGSKFFKVNLDFKDYLTFNIWIFRKIYADYKIRQNKIYLRLVTC